jgi:hypothetical protein
MPRFTSEEQKQNWLAACAKTRAENKNQKAKSSSELAIGFQDQTTERKQGRPPKDTAPTVRTVQEVVNLGNVEEIDSVIQVLTLARNIIVYARGLVSA